MLLYAVTIVSSAFLLFLVQPIVAKQILPWFGGSAAVWTVCVVFFQALLLAGYGYAHALVRRPARQQALVHVALLAISVATLPIVASPAWKPTGETDPTWRIVGLLVATVGLPYFLLSSTGPLLQKWVADTRTSDASRTTVYRLFALSNVGSLVGLVAYPFVVEPYAGLLAQSWGWTAGYAAFAIACAACAWNAASRTGASARDESGTDLGRRGDGAEAVAPAGPGSSSSADDAAPSPARYLFWLAAAATGTMLLLALTNHITQNVASIPFLWVLPLGLYLLSFVIVFEGRGGRGWYVPHWWLAPALAAVIAMAWALVANRGVLNLYIALPLYLVGLFVACVFCHGELARSKPSTRYLTQFYLCLSAGGAIGGLFVALAAPALFVNYWETPIALFAVASIAAITLLERRESGWPTSLALGTTAAAAIFLAAGGPLFEPIRAGLNLPNDGWPVWTLVAIAVTLFVVATMKRMPMALVVAGVLCTGYYAAHYYRVMSQDTLYASRNFYGALRVKDTPSDPRHRRNLLHGVILHGSQFLDTAEDRRRPTTYYGPGSGIDLALRLRAPGTPLAVAMIGLGTGTLTAWGSAGDRYRVYELNPAVPAIARREFTYLADTRAAVDIVLGDARLSMERELADGSATPFDVIAVDAFSSDSIPVHLITREALDVFVRHLKPDGIIAFHVSNRFLRLAPVVKQLADDAQLLAVDVVHRPADDTEAISEWVLVTRNRAFLQHDAIRTHASTIDPIVGLPMWTDQYNNLFKILD